MIYNKEINSLVSEIIIKYGKEKSISIDAVATEFTKLDMLNKDISDLWKKILSDWETINTSGKEKYIVNENLPVDNSLCFVCLGLKLNNDGSMKEELIGRLNTLLECAHKYPNAYLLCSGGPSADDNKEITEAIVMKKWLIQNGIKENQIITEEESMTTGQNGIYTYKLLMSNFPQIKNLVIVTSDYHIYSALNVFNTEILLNSNSSLKIVDYVCSDAKRKEPYPYVFQSGALLELIDEPILAYKVYNFLLS